MSNVSCSFIIEDFESIDPNRQFFPFPISPKGHWLKFRKYDDKLNWRVQEKKNKKHHHRQQQQQQNTQGLKTQLTLKQY